VTEGSPGHLVVLGGLTAGDTSANGVYAVSTGELRAESAWSAALASFPKAEQQEILRKVKAQKWPRKGAVVESLAYAQVSEVSGPGVK
jgi:hypothetical protein